MAHNFVVGLDIGSYATKAVIGEVQRDGTLALVGAITMPSSGLRKGVVADITETAQSLSPVLAEIKKISNHAAGNIFLGVGSSDVRVQSSIGVVAVSRADSEIYQDDVNRAIASAQAVATPPNRMVLHYIVKEFIVDGVRDIRDPLEMVGNRLEVSTLIIDSFAPAVKNISKCVEMLGGGVGGLVLSPLAAARAVLSKNQRELGVVLVDVGAGKTTMCVYEESKLLHTAIFPLGSSNITNDLAIGVKIATEAAEQIKLGFGHAYTRDVSGREMVELAKVSAKSRGMVAKKFVAEVIEGRLAEIFEFVDNELKAIGKSGRLPAGVVLAGGGIRLPGVVDLARQELKLAVQIAAPDFAGITVRDESVARMAEQPDFVCAVGLLLTGYDKARERTGVRVPLAGALKQFLKYFAP